MDNPEKQIPAVVEQKDGYIEITFLIKFLGG